MNILFVCTGNTCRSPMAEYYFRHLCEASGRSDFTVVSAGLSSFGGEPVSRNAALVLDKIGISSGQHRSRVLTPSLVAAADLIVCMTASHADMLAGYFPGSAGKSHLLLEYAGIVGDVPDPYGGSPEQYEAVFEIMRSALDQLASAVFK